MNRILVVAAHPDDETLGAGGTLLRHRAAGDELHWLIATEAAAPQYGAALVAQKYAETEAVAVAYEMKEVYRLRHIPAALDQVPTDTLIHELAIQLDMCCPDIIYTVGPYDVHSDHYWLFESLMIACKPFRNGAGLKAVYTMEIPSSTECGDFRRRRFEPNVYVDITPYLTQKCDRLQLYESEVQGGLWPRSPASVAAVARARGAMFGWAAAEAFQLVREVRGLRGQL